MKDSQFKATTYGFQSRSISKQYKSKNKNWGTESPYLNKLFLKSPPSNIPYSCSSKPILSLTRKLQSDKLSNKFQSTLTNFQTYKYKQNRLCDTITDGFIVNQRPVSKQQSRSKIGQSKSIKRQYDDLIISEMDNIDIYSDNQSLDQDEEFQQIPKTNKLNRPQTSKGERTKEKKIQNIDQKQNKKRKNPTGAQSYHTQIPICLVSDEPKKKQRRAHPSSAVERKNISIIDDLIKVNTKPIDHSRLKKTPSLPFQSLIGNQFLCLFANRYQDQLS